MNEGMDTCCKTCAAKCEAMESNICSDPSFCANCNPCPMWIAPAPADYSRTSIAVS
jgi:hypothetical protein